MSNQTDWQPALISTEATNFPAPTSPKKVPGPCLPCPFMRGLSAWLSNCVPRGAGTPSVKRAGRDRELPDASSLTLFAPYAS